MPIRVSNAVKQMRRMNKYADLYAKTIDPNATGVIIYSYPRGAPAYEIEIFGADGNTLDVHSVEQQMLELIAESSRWRI